MVHGLYSMHPARFAYPELALTINSVTELPYFAYQGGNEGLCTVTQWPPRYGGATLPIAGSGNDPIITTYNTEPDGGKIYQAAAAGVGDLTTEDFVLELILNITDTINVRSISKRSTTIGWRCYHQNTSAGFINCTIQDSSGSTVVSTATSLPAGVRGHFMLFADRDGSAQWYYNGVATGAAVDISSRQLSLSNAVQMVLGGEYNLGNQYDDEIGWISMWRRAGWLDTHLQATVAAARYNALTLADWDG